MAIQKSLNIFNITAIKTNLKLIRLKKGNNNDFLERLTWRVSLDYFLETTEITNSNKYSNSFFDYLNGYVIITFKYFALQTFRYFKVK